MGYGMTASADGRWFPWVFNFPMTYWSQASAFVKYVGQQEGGMDKLKGKKIVHIFHNSPYGKEANPTLETLSKQFGFELTLLAVDHPGQEQKATWLQVRRINPDWIYISGWGVMNQVAVKEAAAHGMKMDHVVGNWWTGTEIDVIPAGDGAKGYKSLTFTAPGAGFKVHQDINKFLYDKGKGAGRRDGIGEVLYNRMLVNAMLNVEAIRTAMAKYGNKPPHRRAGPLGLREPERHRAAARAARHEGPACGRSRSRARTTRATAWRWSSSGTARSGTSSPTGSSPCARWSGRSSRRPRIEEGTKLGTRSATARRKASRGVTATRPRVRRRVAPDEPEGFVTRSPGPRRCVAARRPGGSRRRLRSAAGAGRRRTPRGRGAASPASRGADMTRADRLRGLLRPEARDDGGAGAPRLPGRVGAGAGGPRLAARARRAAAHGGGGAPAGRPCGRWPTSAACRS